MYLSHFFLPLCFGLPSWFVAFHFCKAFASVGWRPQAQITDKWMHSTPDLQCKAQEQGRGGLSVSSVPWA